MLTAGHNVRESGRTAGAYVLDVQDRPTAIAALSDVLALGVWDAAQQRGLTPGHEVSIAGFDDLPDAAFVGLTSVHQPIAESGPPGRPARDGPRLPRAADPAADRSLKVRSSTGPAPITTR